jgi:cell division protease FtsH
MERKKIFRSVWFWVVLVVLVALTFSSLFSGNGGYQEVSTSVALAQFEDGNVKSATINDKEQTLDLDLRHDVPPRTSSTSSPARPREATPSSSTPTSPSRACWSASWSASCPS